jgi:hypothetical protein
MATSVPEQSPDTGALSSTKAAEVELLAVPRRWSEAILANDTERVAAVVTQGRVMAFDTGVSPGREFLDLIASRELSHCTAVRASTWRDRGFQPAVGDAAGMIVACGMSSCSWRNAVIAEAISGERVQCR